MLLGLMSIAAAAPVQFGSDKLAGFVAGAILLSLIAYTLFNYLRPLIEDRDSGLLSAILVLLAIAAIKLSVMPYFPGFGPDVGSYQSWAIQIANLGPSHTYQEGYFLDYPPGYLYGLWLAGLLGQAIGATGDFFRVVVESPAIVADLALALLMYAYVRRGNRPELAMIAMLLIALNPALLFDTVVWGQSDSVLSFVIMLSLVAILNDEYEAAWGLAAIAVLVKPQGLMILPVLGFWTMFQTGFSNWIRSGLVLIAVAIIGIAPFQIGHEWNWILKLYTSTAAYYHETSVNAFNLMALIGGLRQSDSGTVAGISYFALGMSFLAPLYAFIASILWRGRTPTRLFYATFLAIFGFFMLAPRMHERYLYPAIALCVPLALEAPEMLAVFVILSITCLFNLAYILHTLQTVVFLDGRDTLAMITSALNVGALALAVYYGIARLDFAIAGILDSLFERFSAVPPEDQINEPEVVAPPWSRTDTLIISGLLLAAAITRFWHLGRPPEIVFDEVHFVAQARHYLHGESFLDPHPPLAKLVIAAGIWLFGDHPWSWRVGNATIGTALVGITYLLGRRMTGSRLAGALAGGIILCDGMYLVDSRIAVIDIVYLTCAAVAYLLLFRFAQTPSWKERQRLLIWIGVALGLCLGGKLYIPAVTFLLVTGFVMYLVAKSYPLPVKQTAPDNFDYDYSRHPILRWLNIAFDALPYLALALVILLYNQQYIRWFGLLMLVLGLIYQTLRLTWFTASPQWLVNIAAGIREPRRVGALLTIGCIGAITYLGVFLPHYWLGWWGGIEDLAKYYNDIRWYENSVASATHPYASPWWSWPLMLRPVAYWQNFPKTGDVSTIWGGGNPILWWGALTAMTITAVRAIERPSLARSFLVIGYLAYIIIWVW
ncbi:MAG: putative rane protein, partial [Candidatus Binatus sp.]|nr:putative rane protein [Candidatus Binatus sp.]